MPRLARVIVPLCPHHVTHRGNRGDDIFFTPQDRDRYISLLKQYADRHALHVVAWCLMTNHIHLVAVPERPESLAKTVGLGHRRYARWINDTRSWSGHLWANRYFSTPLDEPHTLAAIKYVELNPVRAGLVTRPEDYPWSSARHRIYGIPDALLSEYKPFNDPLFFDGWAAVLSEAIDSDIIECIRHNTNTGWPTGSEAFVRRLEKQLGRRLTRQKPGRRRRNDKEKRNT